MREIYLWGWKIEMGMNWIIFKQKKSWVQRRRTCCRRFVNGVERFNKKKTICQDIITVSCLGVAFSDTSGSCRQPLQKRPMPGTQKQEKNHPSSIKAEKCNKVAIKIRELLKIEAKAKPRVIICTLDARKAQAVRRISIIYYKEFPV